MNILHSKWLKIAVVAFCLASVILYSEEQIKAVALTHVLKSNSHAGNTGGQGYVWSVRPKAVTKANLAEETDESISSLNLPPQLPEFKLPWRASLNGKVKWTGGPHSLQAGAEFFAKIPAGTGSGLDFQYGEVNFEVLNMAPGTVIDYNNEHCHDDAGLGCYLAIKHSVGGTVMIYGHLQEGSIGSIKPIQKGEKYWYGYPLASAGESGTGTNNVHLHIDFRDGSSNTFPFGNPIGWDMGIAIADGYTIWGYRAIEYNEGYSDNPITNPRCAGMQDDQDGIEVFNYDGSAVKGPATAIFCFPYYEDQAGTIQQRVIATTGVNYSCNTAASTCENNDRNHNGTQLDEVTQFAKIDGSGTLPRAHTIPSSLSDVAVPPGALVSTNSTAPNSNPTADNATFTGYETYPDTSVVLPSQSLVKTWRLRNTGSTTWSPSYQLVFRSGERLGAPLAVNLPPAQPGQEVDVSVPLQIPLNASGSYRGEWQLRNAYGTYFGPKVWYQLNSGSPQPPPGNGVNVELVSVKVPNSLSLGQSFQPEVTVLVTSGRLKAGDMLLHYTGTNYSSHPHVAVEGVVDSGQMYTFRFYANSPMVAPSERGSYESIFRVWANNGWVGPDIHIRFNVYQTSDSRPPNRPTLTAPNDWAVPVGSAPSLCAQANGDPDGEAVTEYRFVIYESAFGYDSGWISSNCVTPTGLGYATYKWHAKVRDIRGTESEWSEDRHFTLESSTVTVTKLEFNPPSPFNSEFVFISVETSGCGGVGVGGKVLVNTATDGSANGEWHKIKDIGPKTTPADEPRWETIEYAEGSHLVRVEMTSCDQSVSVHETTYQITRGKPSRPFPQTPSHEFWSTDRTVTFRWQPALRAQSYTLKAGLEDNPDTASLINETLTATEYTATFTEDYPKVYWWVFANNEFGSSRDNPRSYGIDRTPPTSAVNASRTGVLSFDSQFNVSWDSADSASGVHTYDVQTRIAPDGAWTDWLTGYAYQSALFTGQPGRTYCFRTRAHDIAGNSAVYPDAVEHCVKIDPTQRPPEAWWNPTYTYKRALFIANRMSSETLPSGYPVHLHLDASTSPTAKEVYDASTAPNRGDDVRIVFNDTQEVARHVVKFTSDAIDIWFVTQSEIGANSSTSNHYIYYGNTSAANPPTTHTQVYLPTQDSSTQTLYYFEESSGNTPDQSGNGRDITWVNSVTRGPEFGVHNQGVRLNGSYGTVPPIPADHVTIEAWVYFDALLEPAWPDGKDWMGIATAIDTQANQYKWRLRVGAYENGTSKLFGDLGIRDVNNSFQERTVEWNTGRIEAGKWYHLALTYDGTTIGLWVNGDRVANSTLAGRIDSGMNVIYIGRTYTGHPPLNGRIDGLRISNVPRTSFPYAKITVEPSVAAGEQLGQEHQGPTDLALQSLQAVPDQNGDLLVQAVLKNQGDFPTYNEFFVHLYEGQTSPDLRNLENAAGFWVNAPIAPGNSVTLTTLLTDILPSIATIGALTAQELPTEQSITLSAQADSLDVVNESDKSNNIVSDVQVCLASRDAYEPNNLLAEANSIVVDSAGQTHNLDAAGDADWFQFTAIAGERYYITTSNLGPNADTYLYLYGSDGTTLLGSNDDSGETLASQIVWQAPANGTYYVVVKHWNPNTGGCGTNYTAAISTSVPSAGLAVYLPVASNKPVPQTTAIERTLMIPINDGNDDAGDEYQCAYSPEFNEVYLGYCTNGTAVVSGLRFQGIEIPKGAEIIKAHLAFTVDGVYQNDLALRIYGENSPNALAYTNSDSPRHRPSTTAYVPWVISGSDEWSMAQSRNSPDLAPVIQEIVNHPEWESGNALAFILKTEPSSSGTTHRRVFAWEREDNARHTARLIITYLDNDPTSTPTLPLDTTISDVAPHPPSCLLRNGAELSDRLLEITGTGMWNAPYNLQFLKVATSEESIQFHQEVTWESATRVSVDIGLIKDLLWNDPKVTLRVRLTRHNDDNYPPVSDWSSEFVLADDVERCNMPE